MEFSSRSHLTVTPLSLQRLLKQQAELEAQLRQAVFLHDRRSLSVALAETRRSLEREQAEAAEAEAAEAVRPAPKRFEFIFVGEEPEHQPSTALPADISESSDTPAVAEPDDRAALDKAAQLARELFLHQRDAELKVHNLAAWRAVHYHDEEEIQRRKDEASAVMKATFGRYSPYL